MIIRGYLFWGVLALLACATAAQAQEIDPADVPYTGPAGIPGTPASPELSTPGAVIVFNEDAEELTVTPTNANYPGNPPGGPGVYVPSPPYFATSTIPGDLVVLADAAGGDAPSNWLAVAQFFNPSDPTGALGLLSTEQEGFFARDFGSQGFANFPLMPNVDYVASTYNQPVDGGMEVGAETVQFSPIGAVTMGGQEEIMLVSVFTPAVPEPGTIAIVVLGGAVLVVAARCRRRFIL